MVINKVCSSEVRYQPFSLLLSVKVFRYHKTFVFVLHTAPYRRSKKVFKHRWIFLFFLILAYNRKTKCLPAANRWWYDFIGTKNGRRVNKKKNETKKNQIIKMYVNRVKRLNLTVVIVCAGMGCRTGRSCRR